jgi:dihydropteroate synthase
MGILNVTPDSFSDGGVHPDPLAAGFAILAEGAEIIDVGGESTRPGALPVPIDIEIERVMSVIPALAAAGAIVSVDTRNAATMRVALAAGAQIINDVSALRHDPESAAVIARAGCKLVLMHMRGDPSTMMRLSNYDDPAAEVAAELRERIAVALAAGIDPARIAIDPGIGFAKNATANVALLRRLDVLLDLGYPLLVGVSRKGFIGGLSGENNAAARAPGSIAAGLWAISQGASILRVHDVAQTVQAVRVWRGLAGLS